MYIYLSTDIKIINPYSSFGVHDSSNNHHLHEWVPELTVWASRNPGGEVSGSCFLGKGEWLSHFNKENDTVKKILAESAAPVCLLWI